MGSSEPDDLSIDEARELFLQARRDRDDSAISSELVSLTYGDPDWRWVQQQCIDLYHQEAESEQCRYIAVLCLEHVLRFHKVFDFDAALPVLERAEADSSALVRDAAEQLRWLYRLYLPRRAYLPLPEPERSAYDAARERGDEQVTLGQLLAHADAKQDVDWVRDECLRLLDQGTRAQRRVAAIALGMLYHVVNCLPVLPALRRYKADDEFRKAAHAFAQGFEGIFQVEGYSIWTESDRHELAKACAAGDKAAFRGQLVGLALEDPDWRWVQDVCLDLVHDPEPRTRVTAVVCLTALLDERNQLDRDKVVPLVDTLQNDDAFDHELREFYRALEEASVQDG